MIPYLIMTTIITNKKLTKLQQRVFDFLCAFTKQNGYPPSYSEIGSHFNFSSDGTIRTYLEHLENKGYIKRLGKARAIKILKDNEPISIPIIDKKDTYSMNTSGTDFNGLISDIEQLNFNSDRFALTVSDHSMRDAGILKGDIAIIQKNLTINNSDIAAVRFDNEITLKRILFEPTRVRIQPEHMMYEPKFLKHTEIDHHLVGRFIALVRQV